MQDSLLYIVYGLIGLLFCLNSIAIYQLLKLRRKKDDDKDKDEINRLRESINNSMKS